MPDADKSGDEPNLELPSFGFRRKKKDRPVEAAPEPVTEAPAPAEPVDRAPEPTEVIAPAATEAVPPVASVPTDEPVARAAEPRREDTSVLPLTPPPAPSEAAGQDAPVAVDQEATPVEQPVKPARRQRDPLRLPLVPGPVAAVVTGLVCGFLTFFLALASARGCQAVRGVGSCGGFGLFALLVVLTLTVLIGGLLLRAFRVSDPMSTSFLGIGLMAVVVMLFFLGAIDSPWMLAVIPVLTAITFLVSWWVTTKFVDVGDQLRRD
jgi:hypothetical protein